MKHLLFAIAFSCVCSMAKGQSFQVKDLAHSVGNWEGKLTYLDYTSGKTYTMLANITIRLTPDKKGFIMSYEYPKEPHANTKDTTYVNDKHFGKDSIIDFKRDPNGDFTLITETAGEDGNDHQKAALRHIYQLQSNTYSVKKEVKFDGTDTWIKRNEYVFTKATR